MAKFYDKIDRPSRGAWVFHHAQKTSATVGGAAEFPVLDSAGKAASLLSQLAASEQTTLEKPRVTALAKAAGLNPRLELPELLKILERRRVVQVSTKGDVEVLGLTTRATTQHAADIFDDFGPSQEERAAIALAELTSKAPVPNTRVREFISDEFGLAASPTQEFLHRSEIYGFVDAEGRDADKLYFNGNLFRRDHLAKTKNVLDSLTDADTKKVSELDGQLRTRGCLSIGETQKILGESLFAKLRAAGMYDVNHVANPSGEFGFVTLPSAFHKFNDPLVDDAFDLAKALVAALFYGMTQSGAGRGRIEAIERLVGKLISGDLVGPATAIGEDYRVLETKGVIRVTKAKPYGYLMKLLKRDVGEMALLVLTKGEAAHSAAADRLLPGKMTGYVGPEKTRTDFRKTQIPESKRLTQDVLQALRTKGEV